MESFIFYILFINLLNGLFFYKSLKKCDKLYWVQLIPLAIGAAQSIMQASQAAKQKKEAGKAMNYKNPYIDSAANTALNQANTQRYTGQDADESNVRQGVSDTFGNISRASKSSGDILNAASRLSGQQQKSYQDIAKGAQIFRQNATDKYRQALMQQASVQDQNRQYSESLKGAGQQNKYNALNSLLGGAAASFGGGGRGNGQAMWGQSTPGYNGNTGNYNWGF